MSCLQTRSGPGARRQQQAAAASTVRIERLNRELSAKTRTIQELSGSVEQLQDRRCRPSSSTHRTKTRPPATPPGAAEPPGGAAPPAVTTPPRAATPPSCSPAAGESFPTVFTGRSAAEAPPSPPPPPLPQAQLRLPPPPPGSHVSDVLQEAEALKHRLELVELHAEREKEALEVEVAEAREQLLR